MFNNLYENIGGKIKTLAKWTFIVEAISAVISGIAVLFSGEDYLILSGIAGILLGPIIAWVSSWLLYAFGELVEKNIANEKNTRDILKELKRLKTEVISEDFMQPEAEDSKQPEAVVPRQPEKEFPAKASKDSVHKWLCSCCRNMRSQTPCEHCGKE